MSDAPLLPSGYGPLASPGHHMLMAAQAWRRELSGRLRTPDLRPTQFDTIGALGLLSHSIPDPTQQQVGDFSGMDRMMLSKLVVGPSSAASGSACPTRPARG